MNKQSPQKSIYFFLEKKHLSWFEHCSSHRQRFPLEGSIATDLAIGMMAIFIGGWGYCCALIGRILL